MGGTPEVVAGVVGFFFLIVVLVFLGVASYKKRQQQKQVIVCVKLWFILRCAYMHTSPHLN
jgi:hypothetical protein